MKKLLIVVSVMIVTYGLIAIILNTNTNIELKQLDVKTKQAEINNLEKEIENFNKGKTKDQKTLKDLKKENERLQSELQAKLLRESRGVSGVVYAASQAPPSGDWVKNCQNWAKQADIPLPQAGINLIDKESDCNPNAVNPSSGACGIGQQLPCGKWEHQWNDPVGGLKDMYKYVLERYSSWESAWNFWLNNNWY